MTGRAGNDFPQKLRQIGPISTLEDLGAAASEAARLVQADALKRTQAADDLYDRAIGAGLILRHGEDAVQAYISAGFRTIDLDANHATVVPRYDVSNDELDARTGAQQSTLPRVSAIDLDRFLNMDLPPRATMLTPWLPVQGLAMIYAPRGTGKTRVAHGVCHAIATGSGFLRWTAPKAKRVLLLDGEMPAAVLQEMLHSTVRASRCAMPDPTFFKIAAADLARDGLPDLATAAGQAFYREVIADADLAVIDNISTICRSLKENDADGWAPVQSWALSLRRAGKSALFIHHGGKSGAQRGTSRKEDVLDAVISLRRPPDYLPEQGARFEVHFEKSRGFYGADAEPFEAQLLGDQWAITPIKPGDDLDTLRALRRQGQSIRDIADRTGLSKSTVQRRLELVVDNDDQE
jgi:putative DNA primase/helicase